VVQDVGARGADRVAGALLGLAVGDALGAGYEFTTPGPDADIEVVGGGGPGWAPGEWTDDTAQAVAIAEVLATGRTATRWPRRRACCGAPPQAAHAAILQTPVPADDPARHLRDALVAAVRIGHDTDTVAAIAGQVLGARWGASAVPERWRRLLHGWPGLDADDLVRLALRVAGQG
jgi:ADP-ribosylglycohydrolase